MEDDGAADPLEGWDEGHGQVIDLQARGGGRRLPDGALLALLTVLGAVLGAVAGRQLRLSALGGLVGLMVGAVRRRIWELNP